MWRFIPLPSGCDPDGHFPDIAVFCPQRASSRGAGHFSAIATNRRNHFDAAKPRDAASEGRRTRLDCDILSQ
jgi:hypothetical protein